MTENKRDNHSRLTGLIDNLNLHDHLCLIYESQEEWLETVVPFTLSGLERGEKCIYIIDASTTDEVKTAFKEAGTNIDEYESSGQFSVIHEKDAYTREGFFDPDLMIALLISENEQALREGYPALRITGEMSWALRDYSGAERVLEYEAKLNKNLFSKYPCVALCIYDRWKFSPEIIKGVVMTHPLLIRGGHIYRNFYYIEPDHHLDPEKEEHEVQYLLNNLERERKTWESLQEEKAYSKVVMDNLPIGLAVNTVEPEVDIIYMNENFPKFYHTTRKALTKYDAFWDAVYEDPRFRSEIKEKVLEDCASGDPKKMFWENIPITRNGQVVAYINASNTPVSDKNLMISTVWDVTARVKAERALRESEEEHRRLFETMAQGVIYQAADGHIVSANPAAERILGITTEQLQGKTSMDPRWQMIEEDGTVVPGTEHPTMIALRTGQKVGPVTRGVFHPDKNSHVWLNITAIPLFQPGEEEPFQAYATLEDITERKQAEEALKRVEWMLDTEKNKNFEEIKNIPAQPYGSLVVPDSPGLILEAVGKEVLAEVAADYLGLLETSTAVYEANGDYAFGIFSSGWCRYLDNASRELCKTDDNIEALRCGKWLCHESCWTDTSQKAIETGQPVDTPCRGGLRLYTVPIWANQEVVGAINFGYSDPPWERDELQEIADKYQIDVNKLAKKARAYESRPPFIIELAKDRLHGSAKLIGAMVERKQAEEALQRRLFELEKLTHISSTTWTAETLDEMLSMLLDEILKTLDTDTGAIWLNYPSTESLQFIKARGWVKTLEEEDFMFDQEQSVIRQVFLTRKPYISDDIAADPLLKPVAGARIPEGWSGIFVPLLIKNEPAGVLLISMKLPRMIKTEEHNLLTLLANMAGTAIHRLNLHEETLRQFHWLEATNAVDIAISSSQDLRLTLDILLNHITTQTEANAACLYLYDNITKTLNYADGQGFRSKNIEAKEFKLGESCPGKAALERQMCKCRIEDLEAAQDEDWASILKTEKFTLSICIPLIAKGEIKGVLSTFHRQPLSEDSSWLNFLEALALQAAIAIDNVSLFEGLQRSNQELEAAYDTTIEGWGQAMELRDHETNGHTRRVADITIKLARAMGVEEEKLDHIRRGALLHDISKIGIPDAILFKPGKLDEKEWEIMRRHPVMSYNMLSSIEYLRPALNIPYCHHEKYDGSGYPQGLKGDEIPLEARIFAIIDVYDALTSDRPYRKAWSKEKTIAHIKEQSGKHFDPQVVEVFLKAINEIKI